MLITACDEREAMKNPSQTSAADSAGKAAELPASVPSEVRGKLAELRPQADALPRPNDLRPETLHSIKDEDLDHALTWYVGEKMRDTGLSQEDVLRREPAALQSFYLVWLLEAQVLNGGFNQYFWNVSPELVGRTPQAVLDVGAGSVHDVLQSAIVRGRHEASMRNALKAQGTLQAFSDSYRHSKLDEYDKPFLNMVKDLRDRRVAYVRANSTAFWPGQ